MPSPASTLELLDLVKKSGVVKDDSLEQRVGTLDRLPQDPVQSAAVLVQKGILTRFQAKLLLAGRHRGFKLGAYIIREQLGQGGMGAVYLAEHETLRRKVALKVLSASKGADGGKLNVERFLREARAAAALDHPNIVRIHDVAKEGGVHYLVMEYVDGQTLDAVLTKGGPLPPSRAVGYVAQTAAGLQHAFEKGFVHRDIKPSNLILTKDGTVKILDMGLARSHTDEADKLTENFDRGAVVGTADYISPEQALNQPTDIRSDIYSLGATFFSLITGKPPFGGNTTQKLLQHQLKDIPDLCALDKTLPKDLGAVAARMMAKKPEQRFPTPADVIAALAPWLSDSGGKVVAGISGLDAGSGVNLQNTLTEIVAGSTKRLNKPEVGRKPNKALIYGGGIAAAVLVAGGSAAYLLSGSSDSRTQTPPPRNPAVSPAVANHNPAPNPKPTVPIAAAVPAAPAVEKLLFRFDPAALGTYKNTKIGQKPENGAAYGKVPTGVYLHGHKNDTRSTWAVGPFDGVPAVAFANLTEPKSAQIGVELEKQVGLSLVAGKNYTARVTYQTTGSGRGRMYTQNYETWKITGFTELKPSVGRWSTVEFTTVRPNEKQRLMVDVETTGEANALVVRDVQFLEAGAAPAAETAAFGPARTIFALDLSGQKPFRIAGTSAKTYDPTEDVRLVPTDRAGDGTPPADWRPAAWRLEEVVEFAADITNGRPALVLRNKTGSSGMLFAPRLKFAAGRANLHFEYMTPSAGPKAAQVKFKPTGPVPQQAWAIEDVPGTDGQWVALDFAVDLKGATAGYFEFHTFLEDPAQGVFLRDVTVTEPTPATAAPDAAAPLAVGDRVYVFDPSTVPAEGKFTITESRITDGKNFLPAGVNGYCYKKTSAAEFFRRDFEGDAALGVTNLNDDLSSQIVAVIEGTGLALAAEKAYVLRVRYRTANDAEGRLTVRGPKFSKVAAAKLPPSPDAWRTVDVPFTRKDDKPVADVTFENTAVGEGNTLYLGTVELFEAK